VQQEQRWPTARPTGHARRPATRSDGAGLGNEMAISASELGPAWACALFATLTASHAICAEYWVPTPVSRNAPFRYFTAPGGEDVVHHATRPPRSPSGVSIAQGAGSASRSSRINSSSALEVSCTYS
jgi:hypothetical protein